MIIAVDFDGTIVQHKYPSIGKEIPFAVETLRQLSADGHKLILWTIRNGETLEEAISWCKQRGLQFYAVNSNYPTGSLFPNRRESSPKVEADLYIDDRNIGGIPDWSEIYQIISNNSRQGRHRRHHKSSWLRKLFR